MADKKQLVIFGTGGFAREVLQIVLDLSEGENGWEFLGFLDDSTHKHGDSIQGFTVLGGRAWLEGSDGVYVAVAIGSTAARKKVVRAMTSEFSPAFATLVHPRAMIGRDVQIGEGTIICADTLVTTDVEIGDHVILNLDCTVGHDAVLHDFVTVAPSVNVSGNVTVEEGCDLGTGSTIIQGITIGEWTVVGAGAVAVKDLPANVTAVGAPAKAIKEREPGWHE